MYSDSATLRAGRKAFLESPRSYQKETAFRMAIFAVLLTVLSLFGGSYGAITFTVPGASPVSLAEGATTIATIAGSTTTAGASALANFVILGQCPDGYFQFASASSGAITLNAGYALDYELYTSHTVIIQVTDDGTTPLTVTTTLSITVTNTDDTAPVFVDEVCGSSYICAEVAASSASATVGTYTATDVDTTSALTYALVGGDDTTAKFAYSATGVLTRTTAAFDTTIKSCYGLKVTASDGTNIKTATISITIGSTCPTTSDAASLTGILALCVSMAFYAGSRFL